MYKTEIVTALLQPELRPKRDSQIVWGELRRKWSEKDTFNRGERERIRYLKQSEKILGRSKRCRDMLSELGYYVGNTRREKRNRAVRKKTTSFTTRAFGTADSLALAPAWRGIEPHRQQLNIDTQFKYHLAENERRRHSRYLLSSIEKTQLFFFMLWIGEKNEITKEELRLGDGIEETTEEMIEEQHNHRKDAGKEPKASRKYYSHIQRPNLCRRKRCEEDGILEDSTR
ncbi:hypothetical protein C8R43DRAFT_957954 [Mycena crocata]|nr:hypothetical protein C8R43DRAFT_957954 [Mycena crocata]